MDLPPGVKILRTEVQMSLELIHYLEGEEVIEKLVNYARALTEEDETPHLRLITIDLVASAIPKMSKIRITRHFCCDICPEENFLMLLPEGEFKTCYRET